MPRATSPSLRPPARIAGSRLGALATVGSLLGVAASCNSGDSGPADPLGGSGGSGAGIPIVETDGGPRIVLPDGGLGAPPPASCTNGQKDGDETDVDCGGSCSLSECAVGKSCLVGADCASLVCAGTCQAPSYADHVKNGTETDVDCGGAPDAPRCADGGGCHAASDCTDGVCSASGFCAPASYSDGVKNGPETDVDCGGEGPMGSHPCADLKACLAKADCTSGVCAANVCQVPTGSDGVKNGDESDVDCGGTKTGAARCVSGRACAADADCANQACSYKNVCATRASCVGHHGGDTCGDVNHQEDCCVSLPVPGYNLLDKYDVTAGRMRAFVEATNGGQILQWAQSHAPAWWNHQWDGGLPSGLDSGGGTDYTGVYQQLGPLALDGTTAGGGNMGCVIGNTGARTYRIPDGAINDTQLYSQDVLDEKMLNCVNFYMAIAFCAWDGGYLPPYEEWAAAYGPHRYPWGDTPSPEGYTQAWDTQPDAQQNATLLPNGSAPYDTSITSFGYNYWNPSTTLAAKGNQDVSNMIPEPGRFTRNAGPYGHMDLAGGVFFWTLSDAGGGKYYWASTGSWQGHVIPYSKSAFDARNKYWATGIRCAR